MNMETNPVYELVDLERPQATDSSTENDYSHTPTSVERPSQNDTVQKRSTGLRCGKCGPKATTMVVAVVLTLSLAFAAMCFTLAFQLAPKMNVESMQQEIEKLIQKQLYYMQSNASQGNNF